MAISEAYSGTNASVGVTEFSCPNNANYSAGSAITTDGVYQVFLDVADMVAGDELRIRIYEKCRSVDTQRIIYESFIAGTMADTWVSPSLILLHGWDVTVTALGGTIAVTWSIRQVA
jgi:hypothetical protein